LTARRLVTIDGTSRAFGGDVAVELARTLAAMADGERVAIEGDPETLGPAIEAWSKVTGHAIVASSRPGAWVIRKGRADLGDDAERPIGSRLWLYTNFDCNLRCDYCCVRSSPTTPRRALGLSTVERVAGEARAAGVEALFVTGGEPFLLPDIVSLVEACVAALPTTLLTNGMLFTGAREPRLRALAGSGVVLQISVDSPDPGLHELHRGRGSWNKAMDGVRLARRLGFRVRLAATVSSDAEEERFRAFLDQEGIPLEDRVLRRVALRGFATEGVALGRGDVVPEVTVTARGVYLHPVGADDDDFFVTDEIFPIARAIDLTRAIHRKETAHRDALASIFHCA